MFLKRRLRIADLAAREAAGESLWTMQFESTLRVKIWRTMQEFGRSYNESAVTWARQLVLRDEGLIALSNSSYYEHYDFEYCLLNGDDDMVPILIEAWMTTWSDKRFSSGTAILVDLTAFVSAINVLLREYRISFELVGEEMIPLTSMELHANVVAPTLRLLSAGPEWVTVERAYQKALTEIAKGDPADAITDAGTALQEALVRLGADGNALGPLIRSAGQKGIISAHDKPMLDVIERAAHWVSADRSVAGDTHNSEEALLEDAWLTVHIVGALLLRLSKNSARP